VFDLWQFEAPMLLKKGHSIACDQPGPIYPELHIHFVTEKKKKKKRGRDKSKIKALAYFKRFSR